MTTTNIVSAQSHSPILTPAKHREITLLLDEFRRVVLNDAGFADRAASYRDSRQVALANYAALQEKIPADNSITDNLTAHDVLRKLLPHANSAAHRWQGAWIHWTPFVMGDLTAWQRIAGWTQNDDVQPLAQALLNFVRRCVAEPTQLAEACAEFSALPITKGLQSGALTPILNALRPDAFLLLSSRVRQALNYFSGHTYTAALTDYARANAALHALIAELVNELPVALNSAPPSDAFDLFCHWLITERQFSLREPRHWAVAVGDDDWVWEEWRTGCFVALGWDELGDLSDIDRTEFQRRRDSLAAQHAHWSKRGADQAWRFARQLHEGDRVLVQRGDVLLGMGTISGPYYYAADVPLSHRFPVEWDDLTPRQIMGADWRKALHLLEQAEFERVLNASALTADELAQLQQPAADAATSPNAPSYLKFMAPIVDVLQSMGGGGRSAQVMEAVLAHANLPGSELNRLSANGISRVKNQIYRARRALIETGLMTAGQRGVWALTAAGAEAQLNRESAQQLLENLNYRQRLEESLEAESPHIRRLTESSAEYDATTHETLIPPPERPSGPNKLGAWDVEGEPVAGELMEENAAFDKLRPREDVPPRDMSQPQTPTEPYTLAQVASATYLDEEIAARWVQIVRRKGQAIFYGPPGAGKTFVAEQIARHLSSGAVDGPRDGFYELVQFHAAYAYEDFVQGLRPRPAADGGLTYELVSGRFLDFCRRARQRSGLCVLIIDEINRANLSRVFGELMYLLEYRDQAIHLAGGGEPFRIPGNVLILATMNTADRSIALVDHALRRRFAFIPLFPNYDVLRRFHAQQQTGFAVEPLIRRLEQINRAIEDPNYAVGISYFLRPHLADEIADIWQTEIEPYLEEYFFDQPERVEALRWKRGEESGL
ncbi:MAG: AAA family ATPase [Caldilineaceae bacterium]